MEYVLRGEHALIHSNNTQSKAICSLSLKWKGWAYRGAVNEINQAAAL